VDAGLNCEGERMKTGALNGIYPGKYFQSMQETMGLRGINRERLQADIANIQALGSQLFTTTSAASEQTSILAVEEMQARLVAQVGASSESNAAVLDMLV
jgi:hypothetical protein